MNARRVLLMLSLLASARYGYTVEQLAEHFSVSIRTIQRDFELLRQSGVPVTAFVPSDGGPWLYRAGWRWHA